MIEPTTETYSELQAAYDYFNETLFGNELPNCLITYQRIKSAYAYHSGKRWANREGETTDEIAMNPTYFAVRPLRQTLSSLAHEQCHLWQEHFGTPGRGGYHNKEWAKKMNVIGLKPYNVKNPTRETGDSVTHEIIEGGEFDNAANHLISNCFVFSWFDRDIKASQDENDDEVIETIELINSLSDDRLANRKSSGGQRIKYSCPGEHFSVWGKKDIHIICGECNEDLISFSAETYQ
jgi:predicted SprT family Zn-dependent metalloprotease